MAGYTSFWDCEGCGARVESMDYPKHAADRLCDRCEDKREVAKAREDGDTRGIGMVVLDHGRPRYMDVGEVWFYGPDGKRWQVASIGDALEHRWAQIQHDRENPYEPLTAATWPG